jgi:hypothetical protein
MTDDVRPEMAQLLAARTVDDFTASWAHVERSWDATVTRARRLPEAALHERVDGEWSFVETQRHLVFATDAWLRNAVLAQPSPFHPLGLPHSSFPAESAAAIGLDADTQPTLDDVLAVRAEQMAEVRRALDLLADADLDPPCLQSPLEGWDDELPSVRECLFTVMEEELEHHRYATRDLAVLESRP